MSVTDFLVLVLSILTVGAYACRMNLLHVKEHRISVIALHVALGGGAFSAAVHAWRGGVDLQDACSLLSALMWIGVSLHSWRNGPPAHARRMRHLTQEEMRHVCGGKK